MKKDFNLASIVLASALSANSALAADIPSNAMNVLDDAYENPVTEANFTSFANQDEVGPSGTSTSTVLSFEGNTWRYMPLANTVEVTENTTLTFDYMPSATANPDFQGVMLLPSGDGTYDESLFIRLNGVQPFNGISGLYDTSLGGMQTITVKLSDLHELGSELGGMVFINDKDGYTTIPTTALYQNISLYESDGNPILSTSVNAVASQYTPVVIKIVKHVVGSDGSDANISHCDGLNDTKFNIEGDRIRVRGNLEYIGSSTGTCHVVDVDGNHVGSLVVNMNIVPRDSTSPVVRSGQEFNLYGLGGEVIISDIHNISDEDLDKAIIHDCLSSSDVFSTEISENRKTCTVKVVDGRVGSGVITYRAVDDDGNMSNTGVVEVTSVPLSPVKTTFQLSSLPQGWCGIVSYSGEKLGEMFRDNTKLLQAVDDRMNSADDVFPEGTQRLFFPRSDITFVDGRTTLLTSAIEATPSNQIGVISGAVMPDPDGVCRGYADSIKPNKVASEALFSNQSFHDGVSPVNNRDVGSMVVEHVLSNHLPTYLEILADHLGDARVLECSENHPDPTSDANNDGVPDQYQCLNYEGEP